jgi:hypothetical protein
MYIPLSIGIRFELSKYMLEVKLNLLNNPPVGSKRRFICINIIVEIKANILLLKQILQIKKKIPIDKR